MPTVQYPTWLPQCEPTQREEITRILSEVSESGVIRGRVMHDEPTYRLSLTHAHLSMNDFQRWETWWKNSFNKEIEVTWVVDNVLYRGLFTESPSVQYESWQRVTVAVTLLVKRA